MDGGGALLMPDVPRREVVQAHRPAGENPLGCTDARNSGGGL